jgi:hypothetical protein
LARGADTSWRSSDHTRRSLRRGKIGVGRNGVTAVFSNARHVIIGNASDDATMNKDRWTTVQAAHGAITVVPAMPCYELTVFNFIHAFYFLTGLGGLTLALVGRLALTAVVGRLALTVAFNLIIFDCILISCFQNCAPPGP